MDKSSEIKVEENGTARTVKIEIESTTKRYVEEMQKLFDFDLIKTLFKRDDFHFILDGVNGISGPYAIAFFQKFSEFQKKILINSNHFPTLEVSIQIQI